MIPKGSATVTIFIVCLFAFLMTQDVQAEIKPGFRAASYFDPSEAAIGAEVLMNLDREHTWYFNPNFEYVFLDRSDLWTFNFDFHYDVAPYSYPVYIWVGGGPAILHQDFENPRLASDTDFGVNLFAGVGFKIRGTRLVPYIQPKYTISDNDRFSIAFGLRF